ncbi:MAG: phage adaptor protein [Candidatus Aquicultorales bacterium]
MSVTVANLIARAKDLVQDTKARITDPLWDQVAKDAVLEYSRKRPMVKPWDLALLAGVDTYTLPDGFLSFVVFPTAGDSADEGVYHLPSGKLMALPSTWQPPEEYRVEGTDLWVYPTPGSNFALPTRVAFAHVINVAGDAYPTVRDDEVPLIVKKMKADALAIIATREAQAFNYSEGDTKIELGKRAEHYGKLAKEAAADWEKAVDSAVVIQ